jgi:hypothetical protein
MNFTKRRKLSQNSARSQESLTQDCSKSLITIDTSTPEISKSRAFLNTGIQEYGFFMDAIDEANHELVAARQRHAIWALKFVATWYYNYTSNIDGWDSFPDVDTLIGLIHNQVYSPRVQAYDLYLKLREENPNGNIEVCIRLPIVHNSYLSY